MFHCTLLDVVQVRCIRTLFSQEEENLKDIKVATVDGFQGQEREVIIFSTVRSNKKNKLGFLSDHRRLNVALTRAKRGLIVIGNQNTLSNDKKWKSWLNWIGKHGLK